SSVDNGRFLMVQGGRSTRYGQRPQQAGYITETGSSEEIRSQRDRFRSTPAPEERALPAARGVARDPRAGYGDGGYSDRGYRGASSGRPRGGYADADTTQVTPRLRSQSQTFSLRSSAPRSGQRNYQGRGELAPRSGQRNMQRQGSYRGRSDINRGRMPQGTGRGGSNRGRGGGRAPKAVSTLVSFIYRCWAALIVSSWFRWLGLRPVDRDARSPRHDWKSSKKPNRR
ncbi:MAG: hypothetical protein ACLS3Y_10605, partial [Collinsella sp.]